MLLDCWAIPAVIFLTWMFLKTKYRFRKCSGAATCVTGLVLVVFSDVHAGDRAGNNATTYSSYVPSLFYLNI
jgi:solute carrier family 35 protein F1/2